MLLPLSTAVLESWEEQEQNIFLFAWVHHFIYLVVASTFGMCGFSLYTEDA
jgi:hypothetical protein